LVRAADDANPRSIANRLRSRRFDRFEKLVGALPRPLRILDVGGTTAFWEQRGWAGRDDIQIVTVNLEAEPPRYANIESRAGDAADLSEFPDGSFDVVFSNSVIEHLFTLENQRKMAREVARLGNAYWVQTPNYWFPVEPHFLFPAWQWLPVGARAWLLQRRRWGWIGPERNRDRALERVREIRLMKRGELRRLFPGGRIWPERVLGLTKSWVVTKGFPRG
jgi:hypothetical protein